MNYTNDNKKPKGNTHFKWESVTTVLEQLQIAINYIVGESGEMGCLATKRNYNLCFLPPFPIHLPIWHGGGGVQELRMMYEDSVKLS